MLRREGRWAKGGVEISCLLIVMKSRNAVAMKRVVSLLIQVWDEDQMLDECSSCDSWRGNRVLGKNVVLYVCYSLYCCESPSGDTHTLPNTVMALHFQQ